MLHVQHETDNCPGRPQRKLEATLDLPHSGAVTEGGGASPLTGILVVVRTRREAVGSLGLRTQMFTLPRLIRARLRPPPGSSS